jgi:hypothetical protein
MELDIDVDTGASDFMADSLFWIEVVIEPVDKRILKLLFEIADKRLTPLLELWWWEFVLRILPHITDVSHCLNDIRLSGAMS